MLAPLLLALAPLSFTPAHPHPHAPGAPPIHGGFFNPPPTLQPAPPAPPGPGGGTYTGPGDTVPGPTTPGPGGPATPPLPASTPAPATPAPEPGATPAPLPRTPGAPAPSTPAGVPVQASSPRPAGVTDLYHWSHWWRLERDLFLWSPERLRSRVTVRTGSGDEIPAPGSKRPSVEQIENGVVPALLDALNGERYDDVQTASLIALARMGSAVSPALADVIRGAIIGKLDASSQEVSETAALALGILGGEASFAPLVALLADSEDGSKLVGGGSVSTREQAFAAYGLGLLGESAQNTALRQRVALALIDAVENADRARDDLVAASLTSIGICSLPSTPTLPPRDLLQNARVECVTSGAALSVWLARQCSGNSQDGTPLNRFTRAHGYVALARVAAGARPNTRAKWVAEITRAAEDRGNDLVVRTGALIALGEVVHASPYKADVDAMELLVKTVTKGQALERRFAGMALAWASTRRVADSTSARDQELVGFDSARRALQKRLASGRAQDASWAALALGVQAHAAHELGRADALEPGHAILTKLGKEKSASTIGAFGTAAALTYIGAHRDDAARAQEKLRRAFSRAGDPEARGHLALALGMMADDDGSKDLVEMISTSTFQPEALWSAAVGLALASKTDVTPMLIETLSDARSSASRGAAAVALGRVGDARAVVPLVELASDKSQPAIARAYGIIGLGVVCDDDRVPWRVPIAHAMPYFAATPVLVGAGRGLLEIL